MRCIKHLQVILLTLFLSNSVFAAVGNSCDYIREIEEHFLLFQPPASQFKEWLKTRNLKDYRFYSILYRLKTAPQRTPPLCNQVGSQLVGYYGIRTATAPAFRALSDFEALSIRLYTSEDYAIINALLRTGQGAELETFISVMDQALAKLPAFQGISYRGANLPAWLDKDYQPGKIVKELAYLSSSARVKYPGKYRMLIHGHSGRWVAPISQNKGEEEILFQRGSVFRILKREEKYGLIQLEMIEL